jgi:glycosyltransferase involved in cell wall biosynthesis
MKIAYVYEYDASDPATQSGRPFSIWRELDNRFKVVKCFPIPNISRTLLAPKKIWHSARGKEHHLEREWLSLKEYAWRVGLYLARERPDVVFSPSQLVITYLKMNAKIIYCNDAPFGAVASYYPNFSNLSEEYMKQGYRQEYLSHQNADLIVYPSAWARDCAISLHAAEPGKCREQAFGANLPYIPSWSEVQAAIDRRVGRKEVSLLLISSDWQRKGGGFAVGVVEELIRKGVNAKVKVIGTAPEGLQSVEAVGRINKWTETGAEIFKATTLDCNFIIMPSLAEAYGMALWEGAAHGLPMIGRATGGITSIIHDQQNGLLYPSDAEPIFVANWIEQAIAAKTYRCLSERAFAEYRQRGNWQSFVDNIFDL